MFETYLDILIRTVTAFAAILLLTRLTGRRVIGQLTVPNFVSALAMGTVAGALSIGDHSGVGAVLFALVLWVALTVGLDRLALQNRRLRMLVDGGPTVVVHDGKILEDRMRKLSFCLDDLHSMLREQGAFSLAEVEYAVLEPTGKLSVLKRGEHRPATRSDLHLPPGPPGLSLSLIRDGEVEERNLKTAGRDRSWLEQELARRGVAAEEVVLAELDPAGNLYIDRRADQLGPG